MVSANDGDLNVVLREMIERYRDAFEEMANGPMPTMPELIAGIAEVGEEMRRLRARLYDQQCEMSRLARELGVARHRLIAAEAARDHWKANHDNQVAIKRALSKRTDLPAGDEIRQLLARETNRADAMMTRAEAILKLAGFDPSALTERVEKA